MRGFFDKLEGNGLSTCACMRGYACERGRERGFMDVWRWLFGGFRVGINGSGEGCDGDSFEDAREGLFFQVLCNDCFGCNGNWVAFSVCRRSEICIISLEIE